jgi:predicted nucleic acid-binding protein
VFLLDTNTFDLFVEGDENLLQKIQQEHGRVFLSSIAAEEKVVGRLNNINRARSRRTSLSLAKAHADFTQTLEDFKLLPVLAYSEAADALFKTFPAALLRVGAQDCRIAAQAMAHGLTVVTRNLRDFENIGAPCTDWGN